MESEGFLMTAQDYVLWTNGVKKFIDNQNVSPACRMCGERVETVSRLVAECTALAQKQYKSSGALNVNFRKIYVRKTIWDLEFSEHLL